MKPIVAAAAAATLFLLCAGPLSAAPPELASPVYIYDGAGPISVDYMSSPAVADWNNDGRKDLLVSEFTGGKVWLFLNQGTDLNPVFNGGTYVESNGTPITTTYG